MILSFFNRQIYQRILLPAGNNADFYYYMGSARFWLEEDLFLHLEVLNKKWRVCPHDSYHLFVLEGTEETPVLEPFDLEDRAEFRILSANGEALTMVVRDEPHEVRPYTRLVLQEGMHYSIGCGQDSDIRYTELDRVVDNHAMISCKDHVAQLLSMAGEGVYLNGTVVRGTRELSFGDIIDVYGLRMVYLQDALALDTREAVADGALQRAPEMTADESVADPVPAPVHKLYRRAPRNVEPLHTDMVVIEGPPEQVREKKQSWFQILGNSVLMVIPMLIGCTMMIAAARAAGGAGSLFMYSGLAMAGASAIIGVIWAFMNNRSRQKELKAEENHRFEAYGNYLIKKTDEIHKCYEENREILHRQYPAVEELVAYGRAGAKLWDRNTAQEDFLKVRLGLGDIPFQVTVQIPEERFHLYDDSLRGKPAWIRDNFKTLYNVPVLLDLKEHPLVGLVGGEEKYGAYEIARTISLCLAATHSYTDLKMVFLYDGAKESGLWDFARWLPHTWSEDRKIRYIGKDAHDIRDVCYELNNLFHERMEHLTEKDKTEGFFPHFVIFISDPALIENELMTGYIYRDAGHVGLSTLILTELREDLPNACDYFLVNDGSNDGIDVNGTHENVVFDQVPQKELTDFARRISGIRVRETSKGSEMPDAIDFMEMYHVSTLEELEVYERWLKNNVYENIRGLLGVKGGGEPLYLDLHEKYHGPHGLVAGTTGSGKSETLQTYLLSLAVEYGPDDVNFFVIDYKGGGMANLFENLPHMSGSISNLSGPSVHRAMVSIKAEIRRRQRLFNEAYVNNINKYTQMYKSGEVSEPIPHLLIVIDEFAELKREEPDFMQELISVAQVGRSLGVHLILATQKPSGTVNDNIWSNSKFRLCLRVQTKEDSMDMLGRPDAAYITQAGRGFLQVGNDELYELFQSGYSGAMYDPEGGIDKYATALLTGTGREELRYTRRKEKRSDRKEITQLDAVKAYLTEVAQKQDYRPSHQLWMPILRNPIYLEEFEEYTQRAADPDGWKTDAEQMRRNWDLKVLIGQTDDPRNQAQKPLTISFGEGGSYGVIGSIVSGKSTLLTTILYSLMTTYSPECVNVYAIDYSSHMLSAFEGYSHVGGVLYEGEEEKTARFFNMLRDILQERKARYRGGNYAQYVRANGLRDPAIILAIDNFAAFNEKTSEAYLDTLITLSREGVSNGIFLLISAAGFGMNEIPNRLADNIGSILTLALADRFAYSDVLHLTKVDVLPETSFKGRGLCRIGDTVLEFQTALSLPAQDDYTRMEKIRKKGDELNALWDGPVARPIPEIPENPVFEDFVRLPQTIEALQDARLLPLGYRADNAQIYSIDLYHVYCYLVAGTRRTGKSSLLRAMILTALQKENAGITLIDGTGKLKDLYQEEGLRTVLTSEELYQFCFEELTPAFKERNVLRHALLEQILEEDEYYAGLKEQKPRFIFITDMVWFIETVYEDTHDMGGFMETLFKKGEGHKIYFIASLSLDDRNEAAGYQAFTDFVKYGTGIHLGGNAAQNPYLNFEYISFAERTKPLAAGVGQLPETEYGRTADRVVLPFAAKKRKVTQSDDR